MSPPAFGRNRRRYWRHFGTPRYDWLRNRALQLALPRFDFGEADWRAHGAGDVRAALRGYAAAHGLAERGRYVLTTSGMWGGYAHIEAARPLVRALLQASRYAERNRRLLEAQRDPARLLVGLHVRLGDFRPVTSAADYGSVWNVRLPMAWYLNVARRLVRQFGDGVQFLVVSDGNAAQLQPLLDAVPCLTTASFGDSDCSDLLALADADLLVCSLSSFSQWAAFLSSSPYLWYAPTLRRHAAGHGSIWGSEDGVADTTAAADRAAGVLAGDAAPDLRGLPVDADGELPVAFLEAVQARRRDWPLANDLVRGGRVPLRIGR